MAKKKQICLECAESAKFVRHTQFAGSHPYCATHAKQQKDFKSRDVFWEDLNKK